MKLKFSQVDVFSAVPFRGNPLAVVAGADSLSDAQMQAIANWTNLSETTFLCRPQNPPADYRVRIFTPTRELPFAGHPTLGSASVWLALGGEPQAEEIAQDCGAGLIRIRREGGRLAFAAPPLCRTGPLAADLVDSVAKGLGLASAAIRASQWVDNGPGWIGVLLGSRAQLLAIQRDFSILPNQPIGVIAPCDPATDDIDADFEVRAFVGGRAAEDPVTGSLNASLAQWLIGAGLAPASYVAAQGTVLGRAGRVHVAQDGDDTWIGGAVTHSIEGTIEV
jgi:PhzF family phenazine biosynthesis protein